MKELKKYYCKICKRELIPRDMKQTPRDDSDDIFSPDDYFEKRRISLHHIDYKNNIAIRVCKDCHNKLHTTMKKHKYGYNNIIRKNGTKKGRLYPSDYPKKIIE
jgi:RNase P subunit RPR2